MPQTAYECVAENNKLFCHFLMYFNLGNASESITGTYHFFLLHFPSEEKQERGNIDNCIARDA